MPFKDERWTIQKKDDKWVVVNQAGRVFGTHETKNDAREQQKALYYHQGRKSGGHNK